MLEGIEHYDLLHAFQPSQCPGATLSPNILCRPNIVLFLNYILVINITAAWIMFDGKNVFLQWMTCIYANHAADRCLKQMVDA